MAPSSCVPMAQHDWRTVRHTSPSRITKPRHSASALHAASHWLAGTPGLRVRPGQMPSTPCSTNGDVGAPVGASVGAAVVGERVGASVGEVLGLSVGLRVGLRVGAAVKQSSVLKKEVAEASGVDSAQHELRANEHELRSTV